MELSKGTADVITDAIVDYLTSKAPVVLVRKWLEVLVMEHL